MEVTIKPGNPERYTTEPASLTIGARDTEAVERFFAMLTPAAARPSVGDSAAPAEPAAATAASSAGGAIEAQAAAAAAAAAEWSAETSAEWSAERAHLPAPVGLPAGQDAWPWPAQSSLEATLPGAPLAGVVPGATAAAIAPTDVFEQLAQLDESNQALQREVAITASELAHSRAEAERLSVQQHAMVVAELEQREQRLYGLVESTVADEKETEHQIRSREARIEALEAALRARDRQLDALIAQSLERSGIALMGPAIGAAADAEALDTALHTALDTALGPADVTGGGAGTARAPYRASMFNLGTLAAVTQLVLELGQARQALVEANAKVDAAEADRNADRAAQQKQLAKANAQLESIARQLAERDEQLASTQSSLEDARAALATESERAKKLG
ncbi:hypothetical protein Ctob_005846 [Chrysochromulina tobinii]|uniref:Uncharacterized protein n=1 Tax=Chrysochromulina tobinii TaxID=1460289 RepID=A0A0M0JK95_9EUKA|nr:hypothetical protein Ctob_005846 [Chrysochromulina tobinii]|eukprot:KOO26678.1 hypothetical protein Ctob_005846 [Chrysochromulina sp. CCMP291]